MSFLEELYKRRQRLADLLSDPDYSGIREIVEELYPDRAHFIFELLQNAEDAGATDVTFALRHNCLTFEHDGREFNEDDVSAITNIGKGTKKDHEDKIGRFGVGFKAVFAYTETPYIWSPRYSFKICELVLPVEIDSDFSLGKNTRFQFPFNNPKKKDRLAFAEIEAGLNDLEHTALLFLKNIKTIQWHIAPRLSGSLSRIDHGDNHIEIAKRVGAITASAHFLRFAESVSGLERQQVAIAFDLDFQPNVTLFESHKPLSKQLRIVPANPGKVAVFFPAEKETSGLRFHLHGPFVPELSRASIKETRANQPLFEQLARLSADALHQIRDAGLLNLSFLSVLPNQQDSLSRRYHAIREAIVDEMNTQPLTPTYAKGYAPAGTLFQAKAVLKDLLTEDDLKFLISQVETPQWSIAATQRNTDADRFLNGLAITTWDVAEYVDLLCEKLTSGKRYISQPPWYTDGPDRQFLTWISGKSLGWHQHMYSVLWNEALSRQEYQRRRLFDRLKTVRLARLSDGSYSIGRKCFFPSEEVKHDNILPRVAAEIYSSGKSKIQQSEARKFLEEIGVIEVGERQQIEAILKQRYTYEAEVPDEKTYIADLKRFIISADSETNLRTLFANFYILRSDRDEWATPDEIYLDSPFLETGLSAFYTELGQAAGRAALHRDYAQIKLPVKKFFKFLEDIGVQMRLEIKKVSCNGNQASKYLKWQAPGRWSSTGLDDDYTIEHLADVLKRKSGPLSSLVWQTISKLKDSDWLVARYRNNQNHQIREAPSQVVYLLRHTAWIPQTSGVFVRPANASARLLPSGFPFDPGYKWLSAIHFGENERAESEEHQQQQSLAERLGFRDVETLERAKRFAEIPRDVQERILADFLRSQSELPDHEPKNPERRAERVSDQANQAPDKTNEERTRSISMGVDEVKKRAGEYLREQYTNHDGEMICQICKTVLPFKLRDGSYYFEKVEFLKESEKRHYQNYLALCPNHSAMFIYANDSADELPALFINPPRNELDLTLAQKPHNIYFTKTHRADLTSIMRTLVAVQCSEHTTAACGNEAKPDPEQFGKAVSLPRCTTGNRADGSWVRDPTTMCIQHIATAKAVYTLVQRKGVILRSEFRNKRERQIAIRLALLGYLDCSDYTKDATERRFTICASPPKNVLSL